MSEAAGAPIPGRLKVPGDSPHRERALWHRKGRPASRGATARAAATGARAEEIFVNERLSVLVVDDDIDIRETLREVIEAEGFGAVTAEDGHAALSLLRAGLRPSLVVLDLMMPSLNGWDVLHAIRRDPALADLPVAVISAAGGRTPPPGATHFLRKPIDLDALLDLVRDPRPRRVRGRLPSAAEPVNGSAA